MVSSAPESHADMQTRRFTVDDVLRMANAGILRDEERCELIGGKLIVVPPQGPEHSVINTDLRDRLIEAYRDLGHVRDDKPLQVSEVSLPEPDLAVVRGNARDFARAHPHGTDVLLVVETAVTSHVIDRAKAQEYAHGGVAVYWLLDVPARRLEVHTEPQPDGRYRVVQVLARDDEVEVPGTRHRWVVSTLFV
jgi:Uma2 family endonuclease